MAESVAQFELPKRSFTVEFWVGIFALVGILAFSYLAVNIAGMRIGSSGYYKVKAAFTNVSGLKLGAPVEIAGVRVGEVSDIALDDTRAVVTLEIEDGAKLRDDDNAAIRTKGIIGDRYIKIVPGASSSMIAAGGSISDTESPMEFEEVIGKFIHSMDSK